MSITTISDFFLVSSEDGTQVSYEVYQTWEKAQARIDRAPTEVRDEIAIKEVAVSATFLAFVSSRPGLRADVENFCWFGSRVVAEGPHYVIVGAAQDYAESQAARCASGLLGSRSYATLEDAVRGAEEMAAILYR